ncbi:hypothetical protein ACIQCJ_29785 [Streptomyces sp. NPDC093221]|uniref:hypothetical protein n=1 Tax=Streptomyces sp. NPDC093221 TaxID=3366032 RepID=UPI003821FB45
MALTAVVEGLAAVNRPSWVRICVDDSLLHEKRAQHLPPDETELWKRLRPLLVQHHVELSQRGERPDDPSCDPAAEMAYQQLRGEAVRAGAHGEKATLAVALAQFLAERWDDMHAFEDAEEVISMLRFSISWYGDKPIAEMAPAENVDELWAFFDRTLPHKQHASPGEPLTAQHVTTDFLDWLVSRRALDADQVRNRSDSIREAAQRRVRLKTFVDAFELDDLPSWPPSSETEDWIECRYMSIKEKTRTCLTFLDFETGPDDDGECPTVGPTAVRPDIAAQAEIGWSILLSAVKPRARTISSQWVASRGTAVVIRPHRDRRTAGRRVCCQVRGRCGHPRPAGSEGGARPPPL